MIATYRLLRWQFLCIALFYLSQHDLHNTVAATDNIQTKQSEDGRRRHIKSRSRNLTTLRGQEDTSVNEAVNEEAKLEKRLAKQNRAERKRLKMMRRQKKRARMELKRTNQLKPQYVGSPTQPMSPPLASNGEGQYGPPNMGLPPPRLHGEYGSSPPDNMGLPLPPWQPDGWGNNNNHKRYGWNGYGSKASKAYPDVRPIRPHYPPYHPIPPKYPPIIGPPDSPSPPSPTNNRPTFYPTYSTLNPTDVTSEPSPAIYPGEQSSTPKAVQITIKGLYNSYGIQFPSSRAEYDAMVAVLQRTTYDTARASNYNDQRINGVDVVKIEGITPEESTFFRRKLQVVDSTCTFEERRECCFNPGAGNAGFCTSLGCNINLCRRLRIDIIAQQALLPAEGTNGNRNLQSVTDAYVQDVAMNLYNTITQYMTEQVESGAYTVSLRETAIRCGDICLNTMADATVTDVEFLPPDDILIVDPTPPPIQQEPTDAPTDEPVPTLEPTRYPTTSPIIFVFVSCLLCFLYLYILILTAES